MAQKERITVLVTVIPLENKAFSRVSRPTLYYHYGFVKPKNGRLYPNVGHFVVKHWSLRGIVSAIILTPNLRKCLRHRASGVVCQSIDGNPLFCNFDFGLFFYSVRLISAHNLAYLSFSCALTSFVGSLREWSITSEYL